MLPSCCSFSFLLSASSYFLPPVCISIFFFCPAAEQRCTKSFAALPTAPVGLGAVAPPAPLPLIAADAVPHPNVSVELERWRDISLSVSHGTQTQIEWGPFLLNQDIQNEEDVIFFTMQN